MATDTAATDTAAADTASPYLLDIKGLTKNFGGLKAVSDFELAVKQGESGGYYWPQRRRQDHRLQHDQRSLCADSFGQIIFDGDNLVGLEPHLITQHGIGRTFQNIRVFPNLSVLDNVAIAYHPHARLQCVGCRLLRNRKFDNRGARADGARAGLPRRLQPGGPPG